MNDQLLLGWVIAASIGLQLWVMFAVGNARRKTGVKAPATTGHVDFERAFRTQMNTVEQALMFYPALWLCSSYFSIRWAWTLGALWVLGRVVYALGYLAAADKRGVGFMVGFLAQSLLLALGVWGLLTG